MRVRIAFYFFFVRINHCKTLINKILSDFGWAFIWIVQKRNFALFYGDGFIYVYRCRFDIAMFLSTITHSPVVCSILFKIKTVFQVNLLGLHFHYLLSIYIYQFISIFWLILSTNNIKFYTSNDRVSVYYIRSEICYIILCVLCKWVLLYGGLTKSLFVGSLFTLRCFTWFISWIRFFFQFYSYACDYTLSFLSNECNNGLSGMNRELHCLEI